MIIVDAHQDIAFNAFAYGRDYRASVAATRAREGTREQDTATVGLPDALAAGVGLVFGTLFVLPHTGKHISNTYLYRTPDEAHVQAREQLGFYRRLAEEDRRVRVIETQADLAAVRNSWSGSAPQQGIVVLMENADPVRTLEEVAEWYDLGVRLIGPAWTANRYTGGTGTPGPLTTDGRALLREMERVGMVLDVSHMAEEAFWQALDVFGGTIVATHANCRAFVPGERSDRQLSDAMIKALIERDAVIGAVLYNRFLDGSWTPERGKEALGLDTVVRHIDHICQIAGDTRHVGIGSDFDGGFGREAIPRELDSVADLPQLAGALRDAGYATHDIEGVMGGNWLRLLERALPG
ncbi:MAG TPA: membrane dipeptidase [Roseiflexaceae bacterium]|nr:membrane dipeptidase [Roseiflexaceae bacterium]